MSSFAPPMGLSEHRSASSIYEYTPASGGIGRDPASRVIRVPGIVLENSRREPSLQLRRKCELLHIRMAKTMPSLSRRDG
jgi:hypothetical protein